LASSLLAFALGAPAQAAPAAPAAPAAIKIGELYAGSGPFAAISMPVYDAFKLWVSRTPRAASMSGRSTRRSRSS
jgi:branched-chain amino acid transport system substrate-binding protein